MMLTRCPACQTVFRLRAEQLRARHGEVRCGHCFNPFNALDHLIAESPGAPPPDRPLAPLPHLQAHEPTPPAPVQPPVVQPPVVQPPVVQPSAVQAPEPVPHARAMHSMEAFERPGDFDSRPATATPEPDPIGAARADTGAPLPANDADHDALLSTLDFDIPEDLVEDAGHRTGIDDTDRAGSRAQREPTLDEIDFSNFFDPAPDTEPQQAPPAADRNRLPERNLATFSTFAPPSAPPAVDDTAPLAAAQIDPFPPGPARADQEPWAGQSLPDVIRAERRHGASIPVEPTIFAPEPSSQPPAFAVRSQPERARPDNEVDTDLEVELAPPGAPGPATIDTAYLDATYGTAEPAGGAKRTLWGLAVGVLAGTLVMQATYLFRQDIARTLPGLRPLLVAACTRLGCDIPLPREAALIAIETSDLQSEPGRKGRLILHATVKNRADFLQAWPHLEITLTDGTDTPLARKVLTPAEWVAAGRLEAGFAARGDAVVRQVFEVTDLTPSGYRVYVFYP